MTDKMEKEVYRGEYFSVFSDGTIGIDDGVGFVGSCTKEQTQILARVLLETLYPEHMKALELLDCLSIRDEFQSTYYGGGELGDLLPIINKALDVIEKLQLKLI